jgi:membrane protein required for colicin V production
LGAKAIEGVLRIAMLGWLNRLGGILLYLLLYFFIFSIILFYAGQLHILKQNTLEHSIVYPYIQPLAPKVIDALSYILPFFKNMFAELESFFEGMSDKAH